MASLRTAFPRTFSLDFQGVDWRAAFFWVNPELELLSALWDAQVGRMANLQQFWTWTEAMVDDLRDARLRATTPRETDAIDCARFLTCMPALDVTRAGGQLGQCFDWIGTAVSYTHVRTERRNENIYTFLDFPDTPRELYAGYLRNVPRFVRACYYVAYKFGGLDDLTATIAPGCWLVVSNLHQYDPDNDLALEAMVQMVISAAHRNWACGETWARDLLIAAERTSSLKQRLRVAMAFMTPAHRYVEGTPRTWGERALYEYGVAMVEHERLQTYAVILRDRDDWNTRRAEILEEIARLRT